MKCFVCSKDAPKDSMVIIQMEDGHKAEIYLCDEHADNSLKKLKEMYTKKKIDLDALINQAKELGYNIDLINPSQAASKSIIIATEKPPEVSPLKAVEKQAAMPAESKMIKESTKEDSEGMIATEIIDKKTMKSVGGSTDMGMVSAYQSYDFNNLGDKLPENARQGKVKMVMAEGRGGQPIAIPQKRMDGLGETHIMINKAENDDRLQARFKKMAQDSIQDKHANFAQNGYADTTRACPFCKGSGLVRNGKIEGSCPKCGGAGMISI